MHNLEKIQRPDHMMEITRQVKKHRLHLGRVKIHPGQTLWEVDIATLKISPVTYDVTAINLDGSINSEVVTKENHLYCVAINERNAVRKFILMCNKITDEARGKSTMGK